MVDGCWIVPYLPYLSSKFRCHINVECMVSLSSLKYLFKYVHKGPDRAALKVRQDNEVKQWIDGCYISAPDAAWRIFQFPTHKIVPNVIRLQVHLENEHVIVFDPDDNPDNVVDRGALKKTMLTAFFNANHDGGPLGVEARKHTYQEFPQFFIYNKNKCMWTLRKCDFAIGRIYFIKPTSGELFYLRTLLTVVKGSKSFEDLRTVPRINSSNPFPTFHAACLAQGLLQDDGKWRICLEEASAMHTGTHLHYLFATLLLFGEVSQPDQLWIGFRQHICDDLEHCLRTMGVNNPTEEAAYDYGLFLLNQMLQDSGRSLTEWPSMPLPQQDWQHSLSTALLLNS